MTFLHVLEFVSGLYIIELSFFAFAASRSRRVGKSTRPSSAPARVSIIVAAKDEEKNLPSCLESLLRIDYPRELLEIIVVNDQSVDSTPEIIDNVTRTHSFVKRVDAVEGDSTRGKANALAQGINKADGEFVFLTDADCVVPSTWISESLKYFNEDTGIVGGVTLISRTPRLIDGVQALDWAFLLTLGAAAATVRKPLACLGNNLVFRKRAYDEVGGYTNIPFSVTEDFALFKSISGTVKWKYKYPMAPGCLVHTLPVDSLRDVFRQRKRWATGGKDTGLFGLITLAPGFLLHWLVILSIFSSPGVFLAVFLLKALSDAVFLYPTLKLYGKIAHLKFILYFEIYYLLYVAILPFSVYLGRAIIWKGRKY